MMQAVDQFLRSDKVLVDGFVFSNFYSGQLPHQTYDCGCLVDSGPFLENLPGLLTISETLAVQTVMPNEQEAAGV